MIDTEHVKCDTCTAPEPMELDASDEASRGWPTVDIETNPYKGQFPLFQQHPEIAFLDSAATAQRPACVLDAERDFYQCMNANPLRGLYSLSVEATDAIAKVRQQIADLIGASQANEVVFTRNTSESLNLVAKSFAPTVLEPGDEVVITIMEHHSNLIPWQQVCRETGAKLHQDRPAHHRGGSCQGGSQDQDPSRGTGLQRAGRREPGQEPRQTRAQVRRLPGRRRRAVAAAHAGRCGRPGRRLLCL